MPRRPSCCSQAKHAYAQKRLMYGADHERRFCFWLFDTTGEFKVETYEYGSETPHIAFITNCPFCGANNFERKTSIALPEMGKALSLIASSIESIQDGAFALKRAYDGDTDYARRLLDAEKES